MSLPSHFHVHVEQYNLFLLLRNSRELPQIPVIFAKVNSMSLLEVKSHVCQSLTVMYPVDQEKSLGATPEEVMNIARLAGDGEGEAT